MSRHRIVIVTPWFGREHRGGAESLAWELSHRLAERVASSGRRVEVLTTTSRSFLKDWYHDQVPAGIADEDGVTVHRFPVDARDSVAFDAANGQLMLASQRRLIPDVPPVSAAAEEDFFTHSIRSSALVQYLQAQRDEILAVIALPYLYGAVLDACAVLPERTLFHTCLHDEAYAYTRLISQRVRQVARLVFLSAGEQALAARLYGPGILPQSVCVGSGIPHPPAAVPTLAEALPTVFSRLAGRSFVLYLGRRDDTKGVGQLVEAYQAWRQHGGDGLDLVLAGPGAATYGAGIDGVHDVGLVPELTKWTLIDGCRTLVNPSRNESYSRVLMEAWQRHRPVVANRACLATAMAVEAAEGGWLAESTEEWSAMFTTIATATNEDLRATATRGRAYAEIMADWPRVLDRFEATIASLDATATVSPLARFIDRHDCSASTWLPSRGTAAPRRSDQHGIHQVLPALAFGDAISNQALTLQTILRARGYASEILVHFIDEKIRDQPLELAQAPRVIRPTDGLIYHHSIGSEATPVAVAHPGPKVMVYHNITPARFFRRYRPDMAALLERGRADLAGLARHFPHSVSDSGFNSAELAVAGFAPAPVLPLPIDPSMWGFPADPALMTLLGDGRPNILFVGRGAPNKRQDDLIRVFHLVRRLHPEARLVLAGEFQPNDPYHSECRELAAACQDHVIFTGKLGLPQLQACYRTASLFVSLSEHEGFGVPLIEAMWFDIPIVAYGCTAVPEALGGAGLLLSDKDDLPTLAAVISIALTDKALRQTLITAGRTRRNDFQMAHIERIFQQTLLPHLGDSA